MKRKDLKPGMEVAVGRGRWRQANRAVIVEATGWQDTRRYGPALGGDGVAIALDYGDEWAPAVTTPGSIVGPWSEYVIAKKAQDEQAERIAKDQERARRVRDARFAKVSADVERLTGRAASFGSIGVALSFEQVEKLIELAKVRK